MTTLVIIGAVVVWLVLAGLVAALCIVAGRADEADGCK